MGDYISAAKRRTSPFPLYIAGVEVRSNDSSMDRVFEEKEEEEGERERGGAGGGRGGLGVEPVLATSYSANDVSHLREEDGSLQILVPR